MGNMIYLETDVPVVIFYANNFNIIIIHEIFSVLVLNKKKSKSLLLLLTTIIILHPSHYSKF